MQQFELVQRFCLATKNKRSIDKNTKKHVLHTLTNAVKLIIKKRLTVFAKFCKNTSRAQKYELPKKVSFMLLKGMLEFARTYIQIIKFQNYSDMAKITSAVAATTPANSLPSCGRDRECASGAQMSAFLRSCSAAAFRLRVRGRSAARATAYALHDRQSLQLPYRSALVISKYPNAI